MLDVFKKVFRRCERKKYGSNAHSLVAMLCFVKSAHSVITDRGYKILGTICSTSNRGPQVRHLIPPYPHGACLKTRSELSEQNKLGTFHHTFKDIDQLHI